MEIKINVTTDQHTKLAALANRSNMSMEDYIIFKLFGNKDDVSILVEKTLQKINTLSSGQKFNNKLLWNLDWNGINRGTKLSLGKRIFKISKDSNSGFTATKKDSQNTQWYIKD